uniref:(northern house mosquito) hypothetical protein n=1 Tax=Culex pipiens TaxID=7175 RepID=A0A8D8KM61_CULPI
MSRLVRNLLLHRYHFDGASALAQATSFLFLASRCCCCCATGATVARLTLLLRYRSGFTLLHDLRGYFRLLYSYFLSFHFFFFFLGDFRFRLGPAASGGDAAVVVHVFDHVSAGGISRSRRGFLLSRFGIVGFFCFLFVSFRRAAVWGKNLS